MNSNQRTVIITDRFYETNSNNVVITLTEDSSLEKLMQVATRMIPERIIVDVGKENFTKVL